MRKGLKITVISLSVLATVSLGVGVTVAATYVAPTESNDVTFSGIGSGNFLPLSYYFGGGTGASATPFLINNSQHLRNLAKLQNSGAIPNAMYFSLGASFQYEGVAMEPIGNATYPFTGVFNGKYNDQQHSISFLNVQSNQANVGMFGVIGSSSATGTVRQLLLVAPHVRYTGSSTVKIGLVAGTITQVEGQVSVVQEIEIFGGTTSSNIDDLRAKIIIDGGTATCPNAVAGAGTVNSTSGTAVGFISSLATTGEFTSSAKYGTAITSAGTYKLYHNGSGVVRQA